eukprot:scaffold29335_cov66-Phaeocystis_antarctica.AAC.3
MAAPCRPRRAPPAAAAAARSRSPSSKLHNYSPRPGMAVVKRWWCGDGMAIDGIEWGGDGGA